MDGQQSIPKVCTASVLFHGKPSVLSYCTDTQSILIKQQNRIRLNIPSTLVLNFESVEEMTERQRLRDDTDANMKRLFKKHKFSTPSHAEPIECKNFIFAHSRSATGGSESTNTGTAFCSSESPLPSQHKTLCGTFLLHYISLSPNGKLRAIHSLQLKPEEEKDLDALQVLCAALLSNVYLKFSKNMIVFTSPKSGRGEGVSVVQEVVVPILHFSRHSFRIIITSRAHECEDYVADPKNRLDHNHVVVTVGGDGMMHEAINGLHRRRLIYLHHATAPAGEDMATRPSELHPESYNSRVFFPTLSDMKQGWDTLLPSVATVPAGSGCGLAKSLDILHPLSATLALIRCRTAKCDTMKLQFARDDALRAFHLNSLSKSCRSRTAAAYKAYKDAHEQSLAAHFGRSREDQVICPFLPNGGEVYEDDISLRLGAPCYAERIAFLSLSYGMPNDIDRGSERLRWMGGARFAAYAAYRLLRYGLERYEATIRYLPWKAKDGLTLEKLENEDVLPSVDAIPVCTNADDCKHCLEYQESDPPSFYVEDEVDFEDESLPWATVKDDIHMIIVCGMREVARDAHVAPRAHLRDGAIDLVMCRYQPGFGRKEFLQILTSLEKGEHVILSFTNYVKVRALEVTVCKGLVMADGEMMPLSRVRMTQVRNGINVVRG